MTLQEFLNVTAETDDRDLRLALALALNPEKGCPTLARRLRSFLSLGGRPG